jgi:hypothetical protein
MDEHLPPEDNPEEEFWKEAEKRFESDQMNMKGVFWACLAMVLIVCAAIGSVTLIVLWARWLF